jgi:uncharacterized C2H2 Zn-finger protein
MKCPPRFANFPRIIELDYDHEHIIDCPRCGASYILRWDDKEWNYVKDWIHLGESAIRKSNPGHGHVKLPPTLKKPPRRRR